MQKSLLRKTQSTEQVDRAFHGEEAFVGGGEIFAILSNLQALYVATDESRKHCLIIFISAEGQSTTWLISKVEAVDWKNSPDFPYISLSNGE